MRNNQPVVPREYMLREDQYLISRTDLKGRIVYANPAFVEVSGFAHHELLGAAHNIVRHPDMPPEAFADLWDTLKEGRSWTGVVKNRRKDGSFYWVLATVSPIRHDGVVTGYGSVRVRPSREQVEQAGELYEQMRAGQAAVRLSGGRVLPTGWRALLAPLSSWRGRTLRARVNLLVGAAVAGFLVVGGLAWRLAQLPEAEQGGALGVLAAVIVIGALGLIGMGWSLLRFVVQPLHDALDASRQLAAGNLTTPIPNHGRAEVGELMASLDIMRKSLISIASDINVSVRSVLEGADAIARGNADLSQRTSRQADSLENTASAMADFAASVGRNAEHASSASQLADQVLAVASSGSDVVQQAVTRMEAISHSSSRITEIIGVIDGIAFQTNLLALNAAVEAARAGEQGRGFAVVAGEVRGLAQKSAQAAREIKQLIQASADEVASGVALVGQAGQSMLDVRQAAERVTQIMADIAAASRDQSSGIDQVREAVHQMESVTEQNAALVEEAVASADALRARSDYLHHSASVFMLQDRSRKAA